MSAYKTSRTAADPFVPRNLWLAGLGLTVVARREAGNALATAATRADALFVQATRLAVDTRDVARGGLLTLRERVEPKLQALGTGLEARLAPVLQAFGVAARPLPKRRPAKRARKTAPRRRAAG